MDESPVEILLVEDSPTDRELTRIGFEEARLLNPLHTVKDGVEALAFLRNEPPFEAAARPGLILLDLNLPRLDGRQVLKEIKSDSGLRRIPVCVLTTSRAEVDVLKSYDLGANSYIPKPVGLADFITVISEIDNYWIKLVELPRP